MQYITDYQEYLRIGGVLDATAFDRFVLRANNIIDIATHNRIVEGSDAVMAAKYAQRDIIEYINKSSDLEISSKSQTVGGISESESYKVKTKEEQNDDIEQILFDYLELYKTEDGVPILYRGGL